MDIVQYIDGDLLGGRARILERGLIMCPYLMQGTREQS